MRYHGQRPRQKERRTSRRTLKENVLASHQKLGKWTYIYKSEVKIKYLKVYLTYLIIQPTSAFHCGTLKDFPYGHPTPDTPASCHS